MSSGNTTGPAELSLPRYLDIFRPRDTRLIDIGALGPPDSPRLAGENTAYSRALAASDSVFPPILVHRRTMRVIDGLHRLRATELRGQQQIEVQFFDGATEDAFMVAVKLNVERLGLLLSRADRTAAVVRILGSHRPLSDRAIASITGLSHKTVGAIRRRSSGEIAQSPTRIGRDGRARPVDGREKRHMAGELISKRPDASLRQIAKAVGISPGTARNVRDRLRRGDDPTLPTHSGHEPSGQPGSIAAADVFDGGAVAVISTLRGDPALRSSASGRALLRLLEAVTIRPEREAWLIKGVPPHCVGVLAAAARGCAKFWLDFAAQLETRHQQTFEQRPDDERIKVG